MKTVSRGVSANCPRNAKFTQPSGAVYGYRGLVKEILARLEGELGVRPAVVATGGDAALIARGVERIDHVDPDITLNGLRIAAGLNL